MEPKEFDFWQDHSVRYLEMAFRADRHEKMQRPDGFGRSTGGCGDTVEIYLSVRDNKIVAASYSTDGCLSTNACANTVIELVKGKDVEQAWEITPEDVVAYLETLPPENTHCAELAVGALYRALTNFQELKRQPWRKHYQKN